ncbi:MAG: VWA domain-containing protein [Gammaproteobacteria bacterium]|nr:VWA domain-containing protein [Gammaproteobacteria bacterium]
MLLDLFYSLRKARLPVSVTEYLTLLEALDRQVVAGSLDDFYFLCRSALIKDERLFDRFDQVFSAYFKGRELSLQELFGIDDLTRIPEEWLRRQAERYLSDEERQQIESLGGFDELMKALQDRLREQQEAHHGGNKYIGTGGTSPFGAYGYNPEGVRFGQDNGRHGRAVKVWERREFRNLDGSVELGTRNIKLALRQLRRFARTGAAEELDLDGTIGATARNAGMLDLQLVPERRNATKLLLFLDVGGSMQPFVSICEELFSAARSEFKHLEHFYFHNCIYENVWTDNRTRHSARIPTTQILHTYSADYRVIFVGDATMSPYEILMPGGSVEHWNEEAGAIWMQRLLTAYPHAMWLNPQAESRWPLVPSIMLLHKLMSGRMAPVTLEGLERGIRMLRQASSTPPAMSSVTDNGR